MAHIKSQIKRNRQNKKRAERNTKVKSAVRSQRKNMLTALQSKDQGDGAPIGELFKKFVRVIDSAVKKGIIHKNTAARKKSRLAKAVNSLQKKA